MEKNERIAFAALALVVIGQVVKFRAFRKNVSEFATATTTWVEEHEQAKYDAMFGRIIDNFDDT